MYCESTLVEEAEGRDYYYIIPIVILLILIILVILFLIWYFLLSNKYKGKYKPREVEISTIHVPIESMLLPGTDEKLV